MPKEDSGKLAVADLNDLLRAWENTRRMWIAESRMCHVLSREERRLPGYCFRVDFLDMDDNWRSFVNSVYDPKTGEWGPPKEVPIINLPD